MQAGQKASPKIGLFGIGLASYWPQFEGLRERLEGYTNEVSRRLAAAGYRTKVAHRDCPR